MKKLSSFFVSVLLGIVVLFSIVGCLGPGGEMQEFSKGDQNITMLDKDLEARIKQDYFKQFGYNFYYDCFYGNYGDCAVFFVAGDAAVVKIVTVAEQSFQYFYDWEIYVWRNEQFKTLEEAYSVNWLTTEDIKNIANYHSEFVKNKQ